MKQPWWLINSVLLLVWVGLIMFIIFARPTVPARVSFEPLEEVKPHKRAIAKIDLAKIYANDLFDTYHAPIEQPQREDLSKISKPLPPPPSPKIATLPPTPPPRFLEPLAINLKGVIVGSDEESDTAIIEDAKEKKSKNYHVGDKVEDAQLIKIYKNKIVLIRSNGQQETLYVSQYDAELEQLMSPRSNWNNIILRTDDRHFIIDPDLFVERVRSLADLIDLLNITTVYQQGISIGCRIGKMQPSSPGIAMGLLPSDIIHEVNGLAIDSVQGRLDVYKQIIQMSYGDTITVKLLRKNVPLILFYKLDRVDQGASQEANGDEPQSAGARTETEVAEQPADAQVVDQPSSAEVTAQRTALKVEQRKYNQTANELKKHEKRIMVSQKPQRSLRNKLSDGFGTQGQLRG